MRAFPLRMSMPLLGKELTEQAARKRTYVVRVAYAVGLFIAFGMLFHSVTGQAAYGWQYVLGSGRTMLETLMVFQFVGIGLFLPALMSGAIASEKEQASLGLLFLTDIGPWELILQKYFGRLIPMFTFLLLSLPLAAIAYSFGGITTGYLLLGVWLLILTCLQVGAFSLMCSAYCRTTVGAILTSYLGGALFYIGPALLVILAEINGAHGGRGEEIVFCHIPPYLFFESSGRGVSEVLGRSIPIILSTGLFLWAARVFLVKRAFVLARNPLLAFFRALDGVFVRWNNRVGGIVLWRVGGVLPEDEPVAWRELEKRGLGRAHYLFRLLVAIETPVVLLGAATVCLDGGYRRSEAATALVFLIWILATVTLTVQGANTIVTERTHQTLDVLLTTPTAGVDIVRQKMRALRRLCFVLAVPLLSMLALTLWWGSGWRSSGGPWRDDAAIYLIATLLMIGIYLPMAAWVSIWIGLKVRTRFRAIMAALLTMACWCALPPLILFATANTLHDNDPAWYFLLLSPASSIVLTETGGWDATFHADAMPAFVSNFVFYGVILLGVRGLCLRGADRYLRQE